MKIKKDAVWISIVCLLTIILAGCSINTETVKTGTDILSEVQEELENDSPAPQSVEEKREDDEISSILLDVPEYTGEAYAAIDNDTPGFSLTEINEARTDSFISTSHLDDLGRCGTAEMCFQKKDMPAKARGEIGDIKPTGWKQAKYDPKVTGSDSPYLYNRCHLLAYMFSGLNADEKNLITGTRYMNTEGMLYPVEAKIAEYVEENPDMHVLYRVTPDFRGDELLARGVLMEAVSVEDNGASLSICRYAYNIEPGVTIDYKDGSSTGPEFTGN